MTKILVETPIDSTNVVVPAAGEKVTAASLEVPVQSLANRTAFHSRAHLLNFDEGRSIPAEAVTSIIYDMQYGDHTFPLWYACGFEIGTAGTIYQGANWKDLEQRTVTAPPSLAFECLGVNSAVVLAPTPDTGNAFVYRGLVASAVAMAGVAAANLGRGVDIIFVPDLGTSGRWILCGVDATSNPGVWTSDNDGTSWTQRTVPDVNTGLKPTSLASSVDPTGGVVVMAGNDTSGQYWRSSDGITWTEDTEGTGVAFHSVAYSLELDLFMMASQEAGDIFTSADGITWTQVTAVDSATNGAHCNVVAVGPDFLLIVGHLTDPPGLTTEAYLAISSDAGVTWTDFSPYTNDVAHHSITNPPHRMRVTPGGRVMVWGHNATDGASVAVSRMGAVE